MTRKHVAVGIGMVLALAGCGGGAAKNSVDGGDRDGGLDTNADVPAPGLGFAPSNVDLTGLDLSKVADVTISGANNFINGETGAFAFAPTTQFVTKIFTRADSSRLALFVVKSLRLEAGGSLAIDGSLPVAVVALDAIEILGSFDVPPGRGGGLTQATPNSKGAGPGGGPGGSEAAPVLAGSGGSFCGVGGAGAAQAGGATNTKSAAYGDATLAPLVGGSSGGTGALGNGGKAGGALQLSAGKSITVAASGHLSAPGEGGPYGGASSQNQEASGGGSGGALLIEAPTVTIAGVVAVNGGGGGQGNGDAGQTGKASAELAQGGHGALAGASPGGNGGAATTIDGTDGMTTDGNPAGGGGGGAGRIRINARAGQTTITGTLSPSATTACTTMGTL